MHEYLSKHIHEEVEGAIDYLTKALELKSKDHNMAMKFYKMSEMEVEHANCLTKMFNSLGKPDSISDADYSAMQKDIINTYAQSMSKIENMKKLFWEN